MLYDDAVGFADTEQQFHFESRLREANLALRKSNEMADKEKQRADKAELKAAKLAHFRAEDIKSFEIVEQRLKDEATELKTENSRLIDSLKILRKANLSLCDKGNAEMLRADAAEQFLAIEKKYHKITNDLLTRAIEVGDALVASVKDGLSKWEAALSRAEKAEARAKDAELRLRLLGFVKPVPQADGDTGDTGEADTSLTPNLHPEGATQREAAEQARAYTRAYVRTGSEEERDAYAKFRDDHKTTGPYHSFNAWKAIYRGADRLGRTM